MRKKVLEESLKKSEFVKEQIGRKEIWTIPATFVFIMIVGGFIGILTEVYLFLFEPTALASHSNPES